MASTDNTGRLLFQIAGAATSEDTSASFSLSSSDRTSARTITARAAPALQLRQGSASGGRERRTPSAARGRGPAGTTHRSPMRLVAALPDIPRGRRRRGNSDSDDENLVEASPAHVMTRQVVPRTSLRGTLGSTYGQAALEGADIANLSLPTRDSSDRTAVSSLARSSSDGAAVPVRAIVQRGAPTGPRPPQSPRVSPYPRVTEGTPFRSIQERVAAFTRQQTNYQAERRRIGTRSDTQSDYASADEGDPVMIQDVLRTVAGEVMERQHAASVEITMSNARAYAAETLATRAFENARLMVTDAERQISVTRANASQELVAANNAQQDLQARAQAATQNLGHRADFEAELARNYETRFKHEEVVSRTWEHSCEEASEAGRSIRVQACDHIDEM